MKNIIKNLEKKGIISRKPAPIIPFFLTIAFLILYLYSNYIESNFSNIIMFFTIFTFLFAITHLIINKILS